MNPDPQRWGVRGFLFGATMKRKSAEERFWERTKKTPDCWHWTGAKNNWGYGSLGVNGIAMGAHRFAYELLRGPIPQGLQIDHLCRTPSCVNPAHMEVVTEKENILRGISMPAINARKTHCKRGHPLEGDNVYVVKKPLGRGCKLCHKIWTQTRKPWLSKGHLIRKRERRRKRKELGLKPL